MGLAFYKKLLLNYQNASLPLKISVPFIVMFLIFWAGSTTAVGLVFSNQLEKEQREQAVDLIDLVQQEISQELDSLHKTAQLLSSKTPIIQGTIEGNHNQLRDSILPLSSTLNANHIHIISDQKTALFSFQDLALGSSSVPPQSIQDLLLTGSDMATIIDSGNPGPPVLIGTAPIRNGQDIVGGIILGNALGNKLLTQINQVIKEEILILGEDGIVASTFSSKIDNSTLAKVDLSRSNSYITINEQDFVIHTIDLAGLGNQKFELILLVSQQSLSQSLRTLWLSIIPVALLGALVTTIMGYWIAQRVARPILDISLLAQRVAGEQRFDLRATANTKDDISVLALSLNQLIEWVGQYTYELEISAQTLESRVEERTRELSNTVHKLKDTQAQLIQTEKMSSLGQMVAGIAHEINNPISFIQGNIEPLEDYFQDLLALLDTYQKTYPEPEEVILQKREEIDFDFLLEDLMKVLTSMNVGTQRVHEIVKSLRNFSRLDEATVKDVDIHEGLDSTLLILNHRLKYDVTVVKDYGNLPLVRCLPAQINQVFTNIISNALDAMFDADCDHKKITIATRKATKNQVEIIIRDSGPGIPANIQAKIFDPFFTTKPVGKGTGLGLGICFKIIQQHQGFINVRSKLGKGTEFAITLPIDALPAEPIFNELVSSTAVTSVTR
ncbi:sensor histidine kinase [Leptothoe kymatousa]|uniref:histidine kinase n=1 Tax=Leptothoe kymatousa TAU-MAC 1615 TaxID=2364775 RepID=A0ABS5Y1Y7_9CYAN|nr:ATP-binding protein [Leptothoe kymatousa]MBT9311839.1 GHKL domain-containing protein [Leptothoe kymatousa TAU-MAC 1615]